MKSKLRSWFYKWVIAMTLIIMAVAYFFPGKRIDLESINFHTPASSSLYFKNMRAYFYDMEELDHANLKLYRIGSREVDSSQNKLNFLLVNNWKQEACYIMAESGRVSLPESTLHLKCVVDNQKVDFLSLREADSQANYRFAAKLYEHLSADHKIYLKEESKWLAFSESEMKSLKRSLNDYFKWVGQLN